MKAFRSILILITSFSPLIFVSSAYAQQTAYGLGFFKRQLVESVEISGAHSFPESDIKSLLLTKPNHWYNLFNKRYLSKSSVATDVNTIKRFYIRRGFLFPTVADSIYSNDELKASVYFYVNEGKLIYLSGIGIEGGIEFINLKFNKELAQFKENEPINGIKALSSGFALRDLYGDNGYPYAVINTRFDFNEDSTFANIAYVVQESVYTVNGEIVIENRGKTRPNIILRELLIKQSDMYCRKKISESEQRLYLTGLFRLISLRKDDKGMIVENDTCRVNLNLNYEERKSYFTSGGIGVGREDKFEMVLRGGIQFGYRNIAGTGRRIALGFRPMFQITDPEGPLTSFRWSDLKRKLRFKSIRWTFELNYLEPWPLGIRIPAELRVLYEPDSFEPVFEYRYDKYGGEAQLSRPLDKFTIARFNFATEYISIKNVPEDQQEFFRKLGDNQIRRKISISGERDTRDNLFVPQKGSYSFIAFDYVGHLLSGDFNYVKAQFSWSRYNLLTNQNILASRIWIGWLDDSGTSGNSSVDDRFIIGGATTIRGYAENTLGPVFTVEDDPGDQLGKPKGGRYLIIGNLELRRPLFWRFGSSAFLDAGNTYTRFDEITPLSIAFSTGLGIQFFTPVGPIRFDYAVRLKKDFDLGAGNYHLSILYAF